MRRVSLKRQARNREAASFRSALRAIGRCEWCGIVCGELDPHEIASGPLRQAALDKPYAVILLGRACHNLLHRMAKDDSQRAALAILKRSRPEDFDLTAFNKLVNPNAPHRITTSEIYFWSRRLGIETDAALKPKASGKQKELVK